MGSLFKNPNEIQLVPTMKMLIYGQPGIGKSTMGLSAPTPVLFDFDGGVQRVNAAFQCPTLQVQNWEQVIEALEELKQGAVPCKTIIVDTVGKLLDYMSEHIMHNDSKMRMRDGSLSLKGYGVRKTMFVNFLKQVALMGKNIVFIAHEKEDKDGEVKVVRPEIGGSSSGDLIKELDQVGYVQAIGKDRTVSWTPQEKFYAKNTCNLPEMQKIPLIVNEDGTVIHPNDTLTKVIEMHAENLKKVQSMREKYNFLINDLQDGIAGITDAQSAKEFAEGMKTIETIWDSKIRAGQMFKAKLQELNLKYNKDTDSYESVAS